MLVCFFPEELTRLITLWNEQSKPLDASITCLPLALTSLCSVFDWSHGICCITEDGLFQSSLHPLSNSPHSHRPFYPQSPAGQRKRGRQGLVCKYSLSRRLLGAGVCSNVRTLASPAHRSQLPCNHLQKGEGKQRRGPALIQQLLPDLSSQCVSQVSQLTYQWGREGKCVRVICAQCVCLWVCDRERVVSLCWCREESQAASAVFNILILHPSSPSLRTIRLLGSAFGLFRRFLLYLSLTGTHLRVLSVCVCVCRDNGLSPCEQGGCGWLHWMRAWTVKQGRVLIMGSPL